MTTLGNPPRAPLRLRGVRHYFSISGSSATRPLAPLCAVLLALSACGSAAPAGGCTETASRVGISLDIAPPLAGRVATATMAVCWDGVCSTPPVELEPATSAVPASCASVPAATPCSAETVPTGGRQGFADLANLPERTVQVHLTLTDGAGGTVVEKQVDTTPVVTYPNGPTCAPGGPQAGLVVTGDGLVFDRGHPVVSRSTPEPTG